MDIRISQSFGRIGINSYPASMDIRQPKPEAKMNQRPAHFSITQKHLRVEVDNSVPLAEMNYKHPFVRAREYYQQSVSKGIDAIGQIAREGDRLMKIEYGGNPIVDIAMEKLYRQPEFNMVRMPQSLARINVDKGYVNIECEGKIMPAEIDWDIQTMADINATRHNVDVYMDQWPHIEIEYVGNYLDIIG